jgi:hypothetical protein
VIGNLSRDPGMLRRNPYYNKRQLRTQHALYLDTDSLYKMGQVAEAEVGASGAGVVKVGEMIKERVLGIKAEKKSRNARLDKY